MAKKVESVHVFYLASAITFLSLTAGCSDTTTETPAPAANSPSVTPPPVPMPSTAAPAAKGIANDLKPPVVVSPNANSAPGGTTPAPK